MTEQFDLSDERATMEEVREKVRTSQLSRHEYEELLDHMITQYQRLLSTCERAGQALIEVRERHESG